MKRRIKGLLISLLTLTAALITVFALSTTASAASDLEYKITYNTDGTSMLAVVPRVPRNYITFTTDGTKPTYDSPILEGNIIVSEATSFRLAEFNIDNERLWGIKLTVKPKVNTVKINEEYHSGSTNVSLSCDTVGAKIYYTLDGSTPTTDSKRYHDGFIQLTENTYVRAIAVKSGYKNSNIIKKKVIVKSYIDSPTNKIVDKEDDAIVSGTKVKYSVSYHAESATTYLTLSPQKSSNKIYYTTDGSAPSKSSKLYTKKLKFTKARTIRVVEYTSSGKVAATLKYNVKLRCKEVEFGCVDIADGTNTIALSCATEGAEIYYTVNGKNPTTKSTKYTGPFMIGHTTKLKAIAVKDGYINSAVKYVVGADIPISLDGFDYKDPHLAQVVDKINNYRSLFGEKALVHDESFSRAAQKRAVELKVRMAEERPNGLGWLTAVTEELLFPISAFEVVGKNITVDELYQAVISHSEYRATKYNRIGVGYNEYDGDCYWTVIIARQ